MNGEGDFVGYATLRLTADGELRSLDGVRVTEELRVACHEVRVDSSGRMESGYLHCGAMGSGTYYRSAPVLGIVQLDSGDVRPEIAGWHGTEDYGRLIGLVLEPGPKDEGSRFERVAARLTGTKNDLMGRKVLTFAAVVAGLLPFLMLVRPEFHRAMTWPLGLALVSVAAGYGLYRFWCAAERGAKVALLEMRHRSTPRVADQLGVPLYGSIEEARDRVGFSEPIVVASEEKRDRDRRRLVARGTSKSLEQLSSDAFSDRVAPEVRTELSQLAREIKALS